MANPVFDCFKLSGQYVRAVLGLIQRKIERAPLAQFTFKPNSTTVLFYKLFAEDEPKSCALFVGCAAGAIAAGFLEKNFLYIRGNTNPIVGY